MTSGLWGVERRNRYCEVVELCLNAGAGFGETEWWDRRMGRTSPCTQRSGSHERVGDVFGAVDHEAGRYECERVTFDTRAPTAEASYSGDTNDDAAVS